MKKFILPIMMCVLCFSGCVSNEEYDAVKNDYSVALETIEQKNAEIEELKKEIDNWENNVAIKLSQAREAFFMKNYPRVIDLYEEIKEITPDGYEREEAYSLAKKAEFQIFAAEKEIENKRKAEKKEDIQSTLRLEKCVVHNINSADGVDVRIEWENTSEKTIKYINFCVKPYNAVDDEVYCEISKKSDMWLKKTGPINPGSGSYVSPIASISSGDIWECVWYNSTVRNLEITEIRIDYTDGTSKYISGDDLEYIYY